MPVEKIANSCHAKPFLKWAGGKSQLLPEIEKRLPPSIREKKSIPRYIEPFIGGGALFFYLKNYYHVEEAIILDINPELILAYKTIQQKPLELILQLTDIQRKFLKKKHPQRESFFYKIRDKFNRQRKIKNPDDINDTAIKRTAMMIFLNKTCYNGLFRKNRNGGFNVPFGKYENPSICNEDNIWAVNRALKNTTILQGDFQEADSYAISGALVYMDPPYRPLNKTSSFTSYSMNGFTDNDQERLFNFYHHVSQKGVLTLLSNSDPKSENHDDDFFDELYKDFHIHRINALRMINCNGSRRGKIPEIFVTNYPTS
jgi:DNA adenine methylase